MASTNKTLQGFNQWVESDKPKMEDFNTDNLLLEAALAQKANTTDLLQISSQKANLTEVYTRQEAYNKSESDDRFVAHSELPNLDVVAINAALATKANNTLLGQPNGVASLNEDGKVPDSQLPIINGIRAMSSPPPTRWGMLPP